MEDHDNENVTLVLDNRRFKVNKRKLINKSRYFAVLLSKNFKDYRLSEHKINYKIPVIFFQDFINWINYDERNVIINAIENNLERLLILLDLSILFAVNDELTETIINILQNRDLTPQDALNVWLMAKEFSFNMLRDLSFSICLDRFIELPLNLICELSRENFLQLIENTNLRIPKTTDAKAYLSHVAQEWMKVNKDTISLDNLEKTGPKVYQSIIFYNLHNYYDNYEFNLHCWNGDKSFELATFKLPDELINKQIPIGMSITGRGHNLYFIGGEFGTDPKIFNTKVWRYSLISKNWHIEATMPCKRKEMIAVFVQNKLLLAGGLGSFYQKLKALDIYDVHEGTWTTGMDMPFEFKFVGEIDYNVVDEYLICFPHQEDLDSVYIYNSKINYWFKVVIKDEQKLLPHDLYMTAPIIKQFKSASCFVMIKQDGINLKTIVCDNSEYKQKFYKTYLQIKKKYKKKSNFDMYFYFNGCFYNDFYDYYVLFCSKNQTVECKLIHLKRERLPWRSMPIQNLNTFHPFYLQICSTMFFNLMNPADLYTK